MNKIVIMMIATYFCFGCNDIPYQEKEPNLILQESPVQNVVPIASTEKAVQPVASKVSVADREVTLIDESDSRPNTSRSGNRKHPVVEDREDHASKNEDKEATEIIPPVVDIAIDKTPPKIMGAVDGVSQTAYRQETIHYEQRFLDDGKHPRYEIEPEGEPVILDFANSPNIYRWLTNIDDEATAPTYIFKILDDDVASVNYSLSNQCLQSESVTKDADKKADGIYEIKFVQKNSDVDLSKINGDKKYCLSIWAVDHIGNKSNHQVEFFWHVIVPPINMDVNAARYQAHHRDDDVSWIERPIQKLFRGNNPIALKRDLVVGHVIMANPFSSPISVKLNLTKKINLKIRNQSYPIHQNFIAIKYFSYDLSKNEVGNEKSVIDGYIVLNGNEVVIAKFILANAFQINNIRNPKDSFWRLFSLELDFYQGGDENKVVDGLTLTARDDSTGLSTDFSVPWGNDHDVRKR